MKIEIKNRFTDEIILCGEYKSMMDCLEKNRVVDLSGADLSRADLFRAKLSEATLSGANLSGADLSEATLFRADLSGANLSEATLSGANLSEAELSGATLSEANLSEAELSEATLSGANLSGADLSEATLSGAKLSGANLSRADLSRADLSGTILDPSNKPNAITDDFSDANEGWIFGYRTRATTAAGKTLQDDRIYGAEVFSTCETDCHPGWYLWPTIKHCKDFSGDVEMIKVKARKIDIHKAGGKWRSRAIWVIGGVE